jgi:hypothetical protein
MSSLLDASLGGGGDAPDSNLNWTSQISSSLAALYK